MFRKFPRISIILQNNARAKNEGKKLMNFIVIEEANISRIIFHFLNGNGNLDFEQKKNLLEIVINSPEKNPCTSYSVTLFFIPVRVYYNSVCVWFENDNIQINRDIEAINNIHTFKIFWLKRELLDSYNI